MSSKKSNQNIEIINETPDRFDNFYKIAIIGDCEVGKTALVKTIVNIPFPERYFSTDGQVISNIFIKIKDKTLKLELSDMTGNKGYENLYDIYLKNSSLAILVYDITNRASFRNIESWLQKIESIPKVILVGNKIDLDEIPDGRQVDFEEGQNKVESKIKNFIECSAKTNTNVKEIFIEAAKLLYNSPELLETRNEDNIISEVESEVVGENSAKTKTIEKENTCGKCC